MRDLSDGLVMNHHEPHPTASSAFARRCATCWATPTRRASSVQATSYTFAPIKSATVTEAPRQKRQPRGSNVERLIGTSFLRGGRQPQQGHGRTRKTARGRGGDRDSLLPQDDKRKGNEFLLEAKADDPMDRREQ
jgi:hypothetical protein